MSLNYNLDPNNLTNEIQVLMNNSWIDDQTAIAVFEFGLYSYNRDVYILPSVVIEFSTYGFLVSKVEASFVYGADISRSLDIRELILFILVISYIIQEVQEFLKSAGRNCATHFGSPWNVLDAIIYVGLTAILIINYAFNSTIRNTNDFDELFLVAYIQYWIRFAMAVICLLTWVKIFYFLRMGSDLGPIIIAVANMLGNFAIWLSLSVGVLLGFTQYFTVVYGPYEQNFIQYTDAAFSLLQSQFGQYSFADNTSFIRIFTNLMLIGYLFLMIIILVNLLIAMMAQSLKASYRVAFQHHCHIIAELVHHYQKVYIVPPFNIIQFVFDIYNIATKKKKF